MNITPPELAARDVEVVQELESTGTIKVYEKAFIVPVDRTQEWVLLHDATREGTYTEDPYIRTHQPKSVLCLPIVNHGKLTGILYLENTLTVGAFTSERVALLQVIAAQVAISLQNAFLYRNLEQEISGHKETNAALEASEQKFRRLVESNIIGVIFANTDNAIYEANDAFLTKRRNICI